MVYQSFLLQTGTPIAQADAAANFMFAVGDYNRDGVPDLFCLKRTNTGTGKLEVHILSGASKYQSFLLQIGTPITEADAANFMFAIGDYNRDGMPDLYCLKVANAGTGRLEAHVLSGASNYQTFILQTGTPITEADAAANFEFALADYDRDGIPDLYCLKRTNAGTGKLEVHVLSGANKYQSFLLQTGTSITQSDAAVNFAFAAGNYNRDGIPDLYCLKRTNTGTGTLEVHVLDGFAVLLGFSMQTQTQSNWCWSASAVSTSRYYNASNTWTQCTLVNAELGQTTCCVNGSSAACDRAWFLDRALQRTGNLDHWSGSASSFSDLSGAITGGHPLGARVGWSGGGGHFVVIHGCDANQMITVSDPIYGTSYLSLSTFTNNYQGSGTWTDSYFTR